MEVVPILSRLTKSRLGQPANYHEDDSPLTAGMDLNSSCIRPTTFCLNRLGIGSSAVATSGRAWIQRWVRQALET